MNGLGRFKKTQMVEDVERIEWFWVVGPGGAVTTWFSDVKHLIGHSVCSGAVFHDPHLPGSGEHGRPCEFIESECWAVPGSLLGLAPVQDAFDRGDEEAIYGWLTAEYEAVTS